MDAIWHFVYDCGVEIELVERKADELKEIINEEAEKRAVELAEQKLQLRLEEEEVKKKEKIESNAYESLEITIKNNSAVKAEYSYHGKELSISELIPQQYIQLPGYANQNLVFNAYTRYWEKVRKNGTREIVSDFRIINIVFVVKCGTCLAVIITIFSNGTNTTYVFEYEDFVKRRILQYMTFVPRNPGVSNGLILESFYRSCVECNKVAFLEIPDMIGFVDTAKPIYISADSIIPKLEKYYFDNIKEHFLIKNEHSLKENISRYRDFLPGGWNEKLALSIRVTSILLFFYEMYGLKSDHGIVIRFKSNSEKEKIIAFTKRQNYSSTITTSLSDRISKIRKALMTGNDITVLFTFLSNVENMRSFGNALNEIYLDIVGENGVEKIIRKIIIILTDTPGNIPDEFPAYFLSFNDDFDDIDVQRLQRITGEFDCSFIHFLTCNTEAAKNLVQESVIAAKDLLLKNKNIECSGTITMLIATSIMLRKIGLVTDIELQGILNWCENDLDCRTTVVDDVCCAFKEAVSSTILSGELKIAKQVGPPYYSDDGYTAFIREEDKSINMSNDTINNVIIPKISTRSVTRMNKHLNQKGWLKGKHTNKRKLRVAYEAEVSDDTEVFSYSRSVLNAEAKDYVDDIIDNEYWFSVSEYPEGFVPILYNADGTRAAGYVFEPDMDDNLHEVYFGATRSGKTFALAHRAISKVLFESADTVIIFDQTGGFTPNEVAKHIGKELTESYFSFWDVYQDGLPVDFLDLRGCLTLKDERERILRIYVMMTRMLGTYQEQILKVAVNCMVKQMKRTPNMKVADILKYIEGTSYNDDGELVMDEAHRKLFWKLKSVIDDFEDTPQNKNNWGEFVKAQGKPIIVVSTGADSVGKGSEIIDVMLESLYSYKQCYPDSRYTVVIDEAQDLYLHEKGAVNTLLRKGGKHGVAMLMASQSFPDPTTQFGKVVGNCGRVRGYRSKGNDLARYAERFGCYKDEADSLQKGNCFDNGQFWSRYRRGNVIKTLKGKTVAFKTVPDINNNNDEQP